MFLFALKDHENIIKLLDVIKADNNKDIYLIFEFMGNPFDQSQFLASLT